MHGSDVQFVSPQVNSLPGCMSKEFLVAVRNDGGSWLSSQMLSGVSTVPHSLHLDVFSDVNIKHMINTIRKLARRVKRTTSGDAIQRPVIFLHVPKCGGTSIQVALQEAYGLRSGIRIDLRGTYVPDETR